MERERERKQERDESNALIVSQIWKISRSRAATRNALFREQISN
jgi:hypothetical protein